MNIKDFKSFIFESNGKFPLYSTTFSGDIYQYNENLKKVMFGDVDISFDEYFIDVTNHFLGDGIYQKIKSYVEKMFESIKSTDIEYVKDRLRDLYDEYPWKKRTCTFGIIYCDEDRPGEYNGYLGLSRKIEDNYDWIIAQIISKSISDQIYSKRGVIGRSGFGNENRQTDDEIYVLDKKYQMENYV